MERQTVSRDNLSLSEKIGHICRLFNIRESEAETILKECNDNLDTATAVLYSSLHHTGSVGAGTSEEAAPSHVTRGAGDGGTGGDPIPLVDQATGTQHNPIDLTGEGDSELQRALALSLQDMSHPSGSAAISLEEQELSRALEASIADNNANLARMGMPVTSVFVDPLNPHERKRERGMPVGLKNIGNTCWFSSVIQSLFHIPRFCQLILSYQPPDLPNAVDKYPHCVVFVLELQKLFALLHHSTRKYISPDLAIQSLKEAFTKIYRQSGAQQDVSEFTHKLLEWIEDAFKFSHGTNETNPIVDLFNGHSVTEGINNGGERFTNESSIGAFPVQVHGHTHLHDAIDASLYAAELNQETWFTRLPPILVLELSRFQFNQTSGQAEKVHDVLRFDKKMCLDRYLQRNREEARRRRVDVRRLKEKLNDLKRRLASYSQYDKKPISIVDTLGLTLKFVHEREREEEERENGEERAGKRPRTSLHPVPRFVSTQEMAVFESCLKRWIEELTQDVEELEESIRATELTLNAVYSDQLMNSTPYHLHAVLVHQGQASGGHYWAYIRRWGNPLVRRQSSETTTTASHDQSHDTATEAVEGQGSQPPEVDQRVDITPQTGQTSGESSNETGQAGQTGSEGRTESEQLTTDTSDINKTHKTGLTTSHAEGMEVDRGTVGVAEGGATAVTSSDHSNEEEVWLKFNDVSVSLVGWDEVLRESLGGGRNNTSAYCLMYVNEELHQQMKQGWQPGVSEKLQKYVEEENLIFSAEIAEYDEKQKILPAQHIGSSDDITTTTRGPASSPTSDIAPAMLASSAPPDRARGAGGVRHPDRSPEQMQVDSPVLPPIDPQLRAELQTSIEQLMKHVSDLYRQDSCPDPRPKNLLTYALLSKAPLSVTKPLVLETIATLVEKQEDKQPLFLLAKKEFFHLLSEPGAQDKLNCVRTSFQFYCYLCWNFIEAVRAMEEERWSDVLTHSIHAYNIHTDICKLSSSEDFSLLKRHLILLVELRRKGLQGVSRSAYQLFENNQVKQALQQANSSLVPGLGALAANPHEGDMDVLEAVRGEWCQYLTHPGLSEDDQDQLGDLLTRLFEDPSHSSSVPDEPTTPETFDQQQLTVDFSNALRQLVT